MRMTTPAMRRTLSRVSSDAARGAVATPATFGGIVWKSLYFAGITIIAAIIGIVALSYSVQMEDENTLMTLMIAAVIALVLMLVCSFVVMFKPQSVKVAGTLYSLCQGFLLGMVVLLFELVVPGVGFAAILGTAIVFVISVAMNKFLATRVKSNLIRVAFVGLISLFVVELIVTLLAMATGSQNVFTFYYWLQLLITAFCVFYASVMLMWELQTANDIVQMGADKIYEWNVSFSLITTLVYLYIQILELIVRLAMIFGRNKN